MKVLTTTMLMTALFAGLAKAGWHPESKEYNVNNYCSSNGARRVCFTTDADVSRPSPGSDFDGFLSKDGKKFVIYDAAKDTALLQTDKYIINVLFKGVLPDKNFCPSASVTTLDGRLVDSGSFCNAGSRWIHIPA